MRLTQREIEKLMLHQAGFLAQKRLARGLRLNYPESVALIASQIMELIRDGDKVSVVRYNGGKRKNNFRSNFFDLQ
jgi:urease gamma subunit